MLRTSSASGHCSSDARQFGPCPTVSTGEGAQGRHAAVTPLGGHGLALLGGHEHETGGHSGQESGRDRFRRSRGAGDATGSPPFVAASPLIEPLLGPLGQAPTALLRLLDLLWLAEVLGLLAVLRLPPRLLVQARELVVLAQVVGDLLEAAPLVVGQHRTSLTPPARGGKETWDPNIGHRPSPRARRFTPACPATP